MDRRADGQQSDYLNIVFVSRYDCPLLIGGTKGRSLAIRKRTQSDIFGVIHYSIELQ